MSKYQTPRVTRRTVARMLRGTPVTVPDALVGLLAAAAAPPHDGELTGEFPAAEAFLEAARRTPAPRARSRSIHSMLVRLLTVKVAAVAAAICTVGGVATAAVTGHLALPSHGSSPSTSSHPAAGASSSHAGASASGVSSTGHHASPSPSLLGLCHAYTAGAGSAHGKALDNPAFTRLITNAGGMTKVDAYCDTLLSGSASSRARSTGASRADSDPGRSADGHEASTDHPTGPPATHPTGASATHPTGAPQPHPTGAPQPHPTGAPKTHPTDTPGPHPTGAPTTHGNH